VSLPEAAIAKIKVCYTKRVGWYNPEGHHRLMKKVQKKMMPIYWNLIIREMKLVREKAAGREKFPIGCSYLG
jgi:hypothetical protein